MTKAKGELPSTKKKRKLKKWVKVGIYILLAIIIGIIAFIVYPTKVMKAPRITVITTEATEKVGVPNVVESEIVIEVPKKAEPKKEQTVPVDMQSDIIYGSMTGYGANCKGCSGITASGYDVRSTIYYHDATYGQLRILAAPKNIPLYSIIQVSGVGNQEPFMAIVLDRGGAIKGTLFDLLCESEAYANKYIGRQKNVTYEILRRGK